MMLYAHTTGCLNQANTHTLCLTPLFLSGENLYVIATVSTGLAAAVNCEVSH